MLRLHFFVIGGCSYRPGYLYGPVCYAESIEAAKRDDKGLKQEDTIKFYQETYDCSHYDELVQRNNV